VHLPLNDTEYQGLQRAAQVLIQARRELDAPASL
jgi:hypothetical protein